MDDVRLAVENAFLQWLAECGWSRGNTLEARWQFLVSRPLTSKIFHLLRKQGEMYEAEIARALDSSATVIHGAAMPLRRMKMAETERRGQRLYYRLLPSAIEQYCQLRQSPELVRPIYQIIYELLKERGEMYEAQIAEALNVTPHWVQKGTQALLDAGVIGLEHRRESYGSKFYRVLPDMTVRYQQWLDSQKPGKTQS